MAQVRERMTRTLAEEFSPSHLEVIDESHLHAGHAGARPEGETHFRVRITAEAFRGKTRLERHRMVNAAVARELAGPVHALAITAEAPA
ncbi:BolA family transcriptional regulator [Acuticoccus sp. I52.16.1]|uniref:BolA family protein n=1 Tax=Acuticoccus sp. I52.16.1 TaxID=2928472 RepID=UPI001FD0E401|nr:BolA family protein [Acuticoccus sp. I52.16.1]UOM36055.1 BolA family transcriptional regulator [Acuticoccus sp. I52.16.1]